MQDGEGGDVGDCLEWLKILFVYLVKQREKKPISNSREYYDVCQ